MLVLLSRVTWVFSFPMHIGLQYCEGVALGVSCKQLLLYLLIVVGLSVVELLNAFSMSFLPGSGYVLLKGSDVGFSMVLSWLMLGRAYAWGQVLGATFVMGGIGFMQMAWQFPRPTCPHIPYHPSSACS